MNKIVKNNKINAINNEESTVDLIKMSDSFLADTRILFESEKKLVVPIAELATLGTAVSSLKPALRTITSTFEGEQGLFRLANNIPGGTLKKAKDGSSYGSIVKKGSKDIFAKFQEVEANIQTVQSKIPIDPTAIMMAGALLSIEQQLKEITELQKEILLFLELEKQSEIEADLETLIDIMSKFKYNWNNDQFLSSNHKMVLDIQRTARKHMISYAKKVSRLLDSKKLIVRQSYVKNIFKEFEKNYKYYRLSLYSYSLASMVEVMLSKNFLDVNVNKTIKELSTQSSKYRAMFAKGSIFLEEMSNKTLDSNFIHSLGIVGKGTGKVIAGIPLINKSQMDERLIGGGEKLEEKSARMKEEFIKGFSKLGNPGTSIFTNKLKDIVHIYNDSSIYFDSENIYLVGNH